MSYREGGIKPYMYTFFQYPWIYLVSLASTPFVRPYAGLQDHILYKIVGYNIGAPVERTCFKVCWYFPIMIFRQPDSRSNTEDIKKQDKIHSSLAQFKLSDVRREYRRDKWREGEMEARQIDLVLDRTITRTPGRNTYNLNVQYVTHLFY